MLGAIALAAAHRPITPTAGRRLTSYRAGRGLTPPVSPRRPLIGGFSRLPWRATTGVTPGTPPPWLTGWEALLGALALTAAGTSLYRLNNQSPQDAPSLAAATERYKAEHPDTPPVNTTATPANPAAPSTSLPVSPTTVPTSPAPTSPSPASLPPPDNKGQTTPSGGAPTPLPTTPLTPPPSLPARQSTSVNGVPADTDTPSSHRGKHQTPLLSPALQRAVQSARQAAN